MPLSVLFGLQKHSTTGASACPFLVSDFILQLTALFLTSAGVQFSLEEQTNSFLSYKIAEEEEFVNTKKHRSSQAYYLRARCGACARRCFNYVALYQKLFLGAIISCLEHIQVKHKDMSEEILKKIPAAMAEPMMIFKSHTVSNRIVLVLDLKYNQGVDIIVPLELEAVKGREKHILSHRSMGAVMEAGGQEVQIMYGISIT